MRNTVYTSLLTLVIVAIVAIAPQVHAETTSSTATMEAQLKVLMAKIAELQAQLVTIKGEVSEILKSNIKEGTSSDDVKKVQELLATDKEIYPEGLTTGYFGPRTKEAVKRFQTRHNLSITGVVDDETKKLLEEYLKERFGDKIPEGLLRAPGIAKKMEDRMRMKCDHHGTSTNDRKMATGTQKSGHDMTQMHLKMKEKTEMGMSMKDRCTHSEDTKKDHGDMDEDMMDDHHSRGHDDDDDDDDTTATSTVKWKDAYKAIQKATRAVRDATKEINKAEDDTEEATALLEKARTMLTDARKAHSARDFNVAVSLAKSAMNLAEDAEESAEEAAEDGKDDEEDN